MSWRVNLPGRRLETWRSQFRDFGPLQPLFAYFVLVPAFGTVLVLSKLPVLAAALPTRDGWALFALVVAMAVAVAVALVLPSAAAFGAGYCSGAFAGTGSAVLGIALGSVLAQQFLVPRLGAKLLAFMHGRPRANAVRRLCRGTVLAATMGVARLRWALVFPHGVGNLLLAVAAVPGVAVFRGTVLGALPGSLLSAVAGDCWRSWRATHELPALHSWVAAGAAMLGVVCLSRASRRLWRAQSAERLTAPAA